jgi:hypothetical protein
MGNNGVNYFRCLDALSSHQTRRKTNKKTGGKKDGRLITENKN